MSFTTETFWATLSFAFSVLVDDAQHTPGDRVHLPSCLHAAAVGDWPALFSDEVVWVSYAKRLLHVDGLTLFDCLYGLNDLGKFGHLP